MCRLVAYSIAVLMTISLMVGRASAVVTEESVTPASVKENGSKFSVKAEKGKDGLINFTITYRLPAPQYLVAHFEVRDGETTLASSHAPSFVREKSATYYVTLSPKQLADSKFEISENSFTESGGEPVAEPGGKIYQIKLEAFGKDAPAAQAD